MNGEKLKEALRAKGVTQVDLATYLEVNPTSVSRWVNGERNPKDELKRKIADYLDVTVGYLMDDAPADIKKEAPNQTAESLKEKNTLILDTDKQIFCPLISPEMTLCCGVGIPSMDITYETNEGVNIGRSELHVYDDLRPPFAMLCSGTCLESDDIRDGDWAVINPAEEPQNGAIIAYCIYGAAGLKRIYRLNNGDVILKSDDGSRRLTPSQQEEEEFRILGVMVASRRGRPPIKPM